MDHLKSDGCGGGGGGVGGREIVSLHDHNFFHPDKHKYFHSRGCGNSHFSCCCCGFLGIYTSLLTLQDVKNHSLHGVKFFNIQIHMIRDYKTRQGFIVTLRTMYVEQVNLV